MHAFRVVSEGRLMWKSKWFRLMQYAHLPLFLSHFLKYHIPRQLTSNFSPATTPTIIPALLQSNINSAVTKIASGGYITAALTSTRDVYVWGSADPASSPQIIPDLSGMHLTSYTSCCIGHRFTSMHALHTNLHLTLNISGDPTPLIIPDPEDPSREFDFSDIGIGSKHLIVLTTDQRIFVTGHNANGQLGLDEEQAKDMDFLPKWKEVRIPSSHSGSVAFKDDGENAVPRENTREAVGVAAGVNASFVIMLVDSNG